MHARSSQSSKNGGGTKSFPSVKSSSNQSRSVFPLTSSSSSSSSSSASNQKSLASSTGNANANPSRGNEKRHRGSSCSSASSFSLISSSADSTLAPLSAFPSIKQDSYSLSIDTPPSSTRDDVQLRHGSKLGIPSNEGNSTQVDLDRIEFEDEPRQKDSAKSSEIFAEAQIDEQSLPRRSFSNFEVESGSSISDSSSSSTASNSRSFQSATNSISTFFRPLSSVSRRNIS